ncbi:MAG: phage major capsid protein [Patescibacteria group bacterium]|jgi:hypothetical protein
MPEASTGELLIAIKSKLDEAGAKWDRISTDMAPLLKEQGELIKQLKGEKNDRLAELGKKLDEIGPSLIEAQKNYVDLKKAMVELEKTTQRGGERQKKAPRSIGKDFVAGDGYKQWKDHHKKERWSAPHEIKGQLFERKASLDWDEDNNAGALVAPWYRPDPIQTRKRVPIHRKYLTVIPVDESNQVKFSRETTEYVLVAQCTATAALGQKDVTVDSVAGFSTKDHFNAFTSGANSGTIASISGLVLTMTDNLTAQINVGDKIVCPYFVFIAEGNIAARSLDAWEDGTANVEKLSAYVKTTNELLEDAPRTEDMIDRRLLSKAARCEEKAVFYGPTATTGQIEGFFHNASIVEILWSAQSAGTTKLDLLQYAITVLALAEYAVEAIFLNPNDHGDIIRTKGIDGQYMFAQVMAVGLPTRVWGAELVSTAACESTDALAGEFSVAATLYDRQEASVQIGEVDDDFIRGKKSILCTERVAFSVDIPAAVVRIKFDSAPV